MRQLTISMSKKAARPRLQQLGDAAMTRVKVAKRRSDKLVFLVPRWVVFCYQSFQLEYYYQNLTHIKPKRATNSNKLQLTLINIIISYMLSEPEIAVEWKRKQMQTGELYNLMLDEEYITLNDKTVKFKYFIKGTRPNGGYTLIFGFHGGGGCTTDVNNQQFSNHLHLYDDKLPLGTIWFVPRSCEEASDMWWKDYLPQFLSTIIKGFVLKDIVNPNKIFMTGYSAGGDGIYHLGPMLADWLAGAAMMAGHPNGVELFNVRNIAFSIQVGGKDAAYNRNDLARKYIKTMNELQCKYGGFCSKYCNVFEDCEHWMNKKDANILSQFLKEVRNPYPNFITFKQHPRMRKQYFYYLEVVPQNHKELLVVSKNGNIFVIESEQMPVTIYLNRFVVNFAQDVNIWHNGSLTVSRRPDKKKDVINKTIEARLDPDYIFEDYLISVPTNCRVPLETTLQQLSLPTIKQLPANETISHHVAQPQQGPKVQQSCICCALI